MFNKNQGYPYTIPFAEGVDPLFISKAQEWLSRHLNLAKALYDPSDRLPSELLRSELDKAVRQGDYAYYALLIFQNDMF